MFVQILCHTSCLLFHSQHLPIDLNKETKIPADLRPRLAFAQQKLGEIIRVAQAPLPAQGTAAAGEKKEGEEMESKWGCCKPSFSIAFYCLQDLVCTFLAYYTALCVLEKKLRL